MICSARRVFRTEESAMGRRNSLERQITRSEYRGTTYGRKGGKGFTRGRVASVYEAVDPLGATVKVRSYKMHTDNAVIAFYHSTVNLRPGESVWHANGAWDADNLPEWLRRHVLVPAKRIKVGSAG
jgi:hypothetical protein